MHVASYFFYLFICLFDLLGLMVDVCMHQLLNVMICMIVLWIIVMRKLRFARTIFLLITPLIASHAMPAIVNLSVLLGPLVVLMVVVVVVEVVRFPRLVPITLVLLPITLARVRI